MCALSIFHRNCNYQFSKWRGETPGPLAEAGEDWCFKKSIRNCLIAFSSKYHSRVSTILLWASTALCLAPFKSQYSLVKKWRPFRFCRVVEKRKSKMKAQKDLQWDSIWWGLCLIFFLFFFGGVYYCCCFYFYYSMHLHNDNLLCLPNLITC